MDSGHRSERLDSVPLQVKPTQFSPTERATLSDIIERMLDTVLDKVVLDHIL
jgi:hypothetical protein